MEWIIWFFALILGVLAGVFGTKLFLGIFTILCILAFLCVYFWSKRGEHRWIPALLMYSTITIFLFSMWFTVFILFITV